jgi:N-acetyl-gamma-glutamyl-phosphate reductase
MKKIKAGIIGGAGYTGGELIRLLLLHPFAELSFVHSTSNGGKAISDVHTDLLGETTLSFSENYSNDVDVLFLCGGHDAARKFLTENTLPAQIAVIDLSQDLRHQNNNSIADRTFIYGLPELNRDKIKTAKSIANPGCFATAIELALLPLAAAGKLNSDVHINATTGSTGAGQALSDTTHFSWRDSNMSVYRAFAHQHIKEITESLTSLQENFDNEILFIPQRGNFTKGILASIYLDCALDLAEATELYQTYYCSHPFIRISPTEIDIKQVINTNRCFLHLEKHGNKILITSVIDNLLKGSSGQALQNMNLMFGFEETSGLQLKPSAF